MSPAFIFMIKGYQPSKVDWFPDSTSDEWFMGSTQTLKKMASMLSTEEKLEMMKLKDIYYFGVSILEFMIGEV